MMKIALDAMGGDHGPRATVEGAALLSREDAEIQVLLVGETAQIGPILDQVRYDPTRLQIVEAKGSVAMDADPKVALEELPDCSLFTAARLVKSGEASAMVSAGNTGAVVLSAARTFGRLPGIRRAALAAVYPTEQRHGPRGDPFALILDVGATVGSDAQALVGFALMGSAYSSIISEIPTPSVALLSNGTEPQKGTPAIIEAHKLLEGGPLRFVGNVEGLDIPKGSVDVVVCDGFLGNVVLKMLEGIIEVFYEIAKGASKSNLQRRIGLSMLGGSLRELQRLTDWKSYGGAPLLGLDQVVIKAHGRSEGRAIRNAVKVAGKAVRGDLIHRIRQGADALRLAQGQGDAP